MEDYQPTETTKKALESVIDLYGVEARALVVAYDDKHIYLKKDSFIAEINILNDGGLITKGEVDSSKFEVRKLSDSLIQQDEAGNTSYVIYELAEL